MGHRRNATTYTLKFDDTHGEELAGLEITCRGASHDQLFDIANLGGVSVAELLSGGIDKIRALCESFPGRMIDWNHETEDGVPLPATKEVFLDEDYTFTIPVVMAWVNTIRARPKSGEVISSARHTLTEEEPSEDLSDLPMTVVIPDGQLYAEAEL